MNKVRTMQAKLSCGRVTYTYFNGQKVELVAFLDLELKRNEDGDYEFGCMGAMLDDNGDMKFGGQCLEEMFTCEEMAPYYEIFELWKKWHNNGLTPGSPRQMAAIHKWREARRAKGEYDGGWCFDQECEMLKKKRLYKDSKFLYKGKPYVYGSAWLTRKIPQEDVNKIAQWIANPEFNLKKGKKAK